MDKVVHVSEYFDRPQFSMWVQDDKFYLELEYGASVVTFQKRTAKELMEWIQAHLAE